MNTPMEKTSGRGREGKGKSCLAKSKSDMEIVDLNIQCCSKDLVGEEMEVGDRVTKHKLSISSSSTSEADSRDWNEMNSKSRR